MKGYKNAFVWISFALGIVSLFLLVSSASAEIAEYGFTVSDQFFISRGFAVVMYIIASLIALAKYGVTPCIIYTVGFAVSALSGGIFSDIFGLAGMVVLWCGRSSTPRLPSENKHGLSDRAIENIVNALLLLPEKDANIQISNMPVSERDRYKVLLRYRELAD